MVRKVDRELKLEAIRMASLAQLPGRVPQPLRVHRDLLQPRKESLPLYYVSPDQFEQHISTIAA